MLPQAINLYLTYSCQLKCPNCFLVQSGSLNMHELSYEHIIRILDDAAANKVFLLAISGGDPLLHPRFFDIVRAARARNILPLLGSTGTDIDRRLAWEIKSSGISCVQVSLDGSTEEKNAPYRGVGTFKQITQSFKNLVALSLFTNLAVCIDKNNLNDLNSLLKLGLNLGASRVKVDFYSDLYSISPEKELSELEQLEVQNTCIEFTKSNQLSVDWIVSPRKKMKSKPTSMKNSIVIEADGNLRQAEGTEILGNIKRELPSEIYQRFIKNFESSIPEKTGARK